MIDVIKNCLIKTTILSPAQEEELRTRVRQSNGASSDETNGLSCDIVDELSEMLKSLGKRMVGPIQPPIEMATVSELLDI